MKSSIQWIITRLKEESTWRGIVQVSGGIFALCVVSRAPMFAVQIASAVFVIVGMINGIKNSTPPTPPTP